MSGICGIVRLDGAPPGEAELGRMAAAIQYRGPDGVGLWRDGNAGLVHLRHATTPEARAERQPLQHSSGRWVLAADARLDNRQELLALLAGRDCLPPGAGAIVTDADLILAAYHAWGTDCPQYLVGDFAFAIYTPAERRVFLARDALGVRPLVYYADPRQFVFASHLGAVLAVVPQPALNRALLGDWVAGSFDRDLTETPYQSIHRLPAAHTLTLTPERLDLRRYWVFGAAPRLHYRRDEEYYEHFRDLLGQVVRAQLRSDHPVSILGGGGLDSSAIVGLAERQVAAGGVDAAVQVYGMCFPGVPAADESAYQAALQAHCSHLAFTGLDCNQEWVLKAAFAHPDFPLEDLDLGISLWHGELSLMKAARAAGSRVILSGAYGDQILGEGLYRRPAVLRDLPWRAWPAELPYFRKPGRPGWLVAAYAAGAALFPLHWRNAVGRRLRGWDAAWKAEMDSVAPPEPVLERCFPAPKLGVHAGHAYRMLHAGITAARLRTYDQWGAYLGLEHRLPYLDRRLVDFMLQVPVPLLARQGISRYLVRAALNGILPDEIRQRTSKAQFSHLHRLGLLEKEAANIRALLPDARLVQQQLIDSTAWIRGWEAYWSQPERPSLPLLLPLGVELWLRRREPSGPVPDHLPVRIERSWV